jgi:hypothetical protein
MTLGNANAIDLFAEKDLHAVNVQVKAISLKKNVGRPILTKKVSQKVLYVFVCLNAENEAPSYFIANSEEVLPLVKEFKALGIINYGALNTDQFKNRWDKIETALHEPWARAL